MTPVEYPLTLGLYFLITSIMIRRQVTITDYDKHWYSYTVAIAIAFVKAGMCGVAQIYLALLYKVLINVNFCHLDVSP